MGILELPKRFHPDFSIPGKKPSGLIEIDWDNPLTRGLKSFYIMSGGVDEIINLVNGVAATLVNPTGLLGKHRVDVNEGLISKNTTTGPDGSYWSVPNAESLPLENGVTVVARVKIPQTNRWQFKFLGYSGTSSSLVELRWDASTPRVLITMNGSWSQTITDPSIVIEDADWHTMGFTTSPTQEWKFFKDRVSLEPASAQHRSGNFFTADIIGSGGPAGNADFGGYISYLMIFNASKTDSEMLALESDPYQILKPVVAPFYFLPSGGGSTTFTKTASFESVLQKQGIEQNASLSALFLKTGITRNSSVDAILSAIKTLNSDIDSILQKSGVVSTSDIDSILKKSGLSLSAVVDSILQKQVTGQSSVDSVLQKSGVQLTTAINSILQKNTTVQSSFDAVLGSSSVKTALINALLEKTVLLNGAIDALLSKRVNLGSNIDAVLSLETSSTISTTVNAILRKTLSINAVFDALLQRQGITSTTTLDAMLAKVNTSSLSIDTVLTASVSLTASMSALFKKSNIQIFSNMDAIIGAAVFITPKHLVTVLKSNTAVNVIKSRTNIEVI